MKFLLTRELGRLAKWLRILGFDTAYASQDRAGSIVIQALKENRLILTRNLRLARSARVKTLLVESELLKEQIPRILKGLKLAVNSDKMFSRCILCNVELTAVEKETIKGQVPDYVYKTQESFIACPACKRVYWSGTHWGNVSATLKELGVM
jgi:uncharacterized protein